MDRVKAPQIVNFFVSKAGVRKEDIGDIDIKRKFTFVDINKKVIGILTAEQPEKKEDIVYVGHGNQLPSTDRKSVV